MNHRISLQLLSRASLFRRMALETQRHRGGLCVVTRQQRSSSSSSSSSGAHEWRQRQLQKLEQKFLDSTVVQSDDDLQQMWREMEGRVTRRRPRKLQDGQPTGRTNVKATDEEYWLREGLYNNNDDDDDDDKDSEDDKEDEKNDKEK